jgi:hypothetical protein
MLLQPALSQLITTNVYPNTAPVGNSTAQFVSGVFGLDGPKVGPTPGSTSYDWWYFDAVSADNNCSVVIVFYVATSNGFPFILGNTTLSVDFFATFEDGTSVFYPLANLPSTAGSATVVTVDNGSSGYWKSTGAQWIGTPDLSSYIITIDAPSVGIKGALTLESVRSSALAMPID